MENSDVNYDTLEKKSEEGGSGNIKLCADGKYRWIYEFSMLKNPTILFTILKIFMVVGCAPALIVLFESLGSEGLGALITCAKVYGVVLLICVPLTLLSYLIVAALYGWKYIVLFEMDEEGVVHIQQDKQFKKAQGIALITMLVGKVGQGLMVSAKNTQSSKFQVVRTVKGIRRRNTIKLNQFLAHNQIYVEKEDYDFVFNYISSRCKKAKIR